MKRISYRYQKEVRWMQLIRFLVSVPDGLHRGLKRAAKDRGQTLSGLLREILWDWMKENQSRADDQPGA